MESEFEQGVLKRPGGGRIGKWLRAQKKASDCGSATRWLRGLGKLPFIHLLGRLDQPPRSLQGDMGDEVWYNQHRPDPVRAP